MLSNSLGYRFVDRESILERLKAAGHKWEKWTEGFDEHAPRVWEKYDWSYHGFIAMLQSTIMNEAASDDGVIIGRGGNYLLKGVPFALRVRVVAPFEKGSQGFPDGRESTRNRPVGLSKEQIAKGRGSC